MFLGTDFIVHTLLIPAWLTSLFAIMAAALKVYEYRGHYDLSVAVSIAARGVLGVLYLSDVTVINDRVIAIRFALTMLFVAEVMRQGLRHVGKRYGKA